MNSIWSKPSENANVWIPSRVIVKRNEIEGVLSEQSRVRQQQSEERRAHHFIKGKLPMPWLERTARLPGKAFTVGLLLWFPAGMNGYSDILFGDALRSRFGIGRKAATNGLKALQLAGLVDLVRETGRAPRVSIILPTDARFGHFDPNHTAGTDYGLRRSTPANSSLINRQYKRGRSNKEVVER